MHALRWVFLCSIFLFHFVSQAQQENWANEVSKSGKVKVKSRVYKKANDKGEKVQIAEYSTETIADMNFEKAIATMKDVSVHYKFQKDTEVSKRVKTISDNKWVIYYYSDSPWPLPNSDCVITTTFDRSADGKTVTFTGVATPNEYPMADVDRITFFTIKYTFVNLGNGKVKFLMDTVLSPTVTAPDWLVETYFPDGPAEIVEKFILLVNGKL